MNCAVHTGTPATAYCRTCGKALCEDCKRDVMGAIYCEPCIAARLQGAAPAAGAYTAPPPGAHHAAVGTNPAVAGWLAIIPGVGAMYNGQFVKAFIHVVIFAICIAGGDRAGAASPFFSMMATFFWVYMIFDAYKTAKARQMGMPAPDLLGIDRLFGLQEGQPGQPAAVSSQTAAAQPSSETYSGTAAAPAAAPSEPQVRAPVRRGNEPVAAIVLIGLGVLFLLANMGIFHARLFWPLILIGLGIWIAYRRVGGYA